jgi:hypothetical protein
MKDNLKNIRNLPRSILKKLDKLIVNRVGETEEACMLTRDIVSFVSPNQTYRLEEDITLRACHDLASGRELTKSLIAPTHAVLNGTWVKQGSNIQSDANILGSMGMLMLHDAQPDPIPVINATAESLAFYNAQLLSIGDSLVFETKQDLPLTEMSIGPDYVNLYLSQRKGGGGEYVEYHEEPHLWAPKKSSCTGHILLGMKDGEKFYFTGFHIPFKHAVYLSPGTLHSDAYLIGDYLVAYTLTESYSTVIVKDEEEQLKRLKFINVD